MRRPERIAVDADAPDAGTIARAVAVLRQGQLVIYPTDTLYALGGRAEDGEAARRVRAAKGRPPDQPLPVVAADVAQARSLSSAWPEAADRLAERFWPGPLTLVVPARSDVPDQVTAGTATVAVRVPARALPRLLCQAAGALIATSANRSGSAAPLRCEDAVAQVGPSAALALDGGPGQPLASTIVDLTGPPRLLREGPVAWADLLALLG
jgi:L-threonylcarbamoyladenylate synthase